MGLGEPRDPRREGGGTWTEGTTNGVTVGAFEAAWGVVQKEGTCADGSLGAGTLQRALEAAFRAASTVCRHGCEPDQMCHSCDAGI